MARSMKLMCSFSDSLSWSGRCALALHPAAVSICKYDIRHTADPSRVSSFITLYACRSELSFIGSFSLCFFCKQISYICFILLAYRFWNGSHLTGSHLICDVNY